MQNDFEKQVREKMKELNLVPSAPVWDRVEEQIRQKKDRKRAFIWLPLLAMLLAGGIWWMNDASNNQPFTGSSSGTSNVKRETSDVNRETSNVKRETSDVKGETSNVKPQTSNTTLQENTTPSTERTKNNNQEINLSGTVTFTSTTSQLKSHQTTEKKSGNVRSNKFSENKFPVSVPSENVKANDKILQGQSNVQLTELQKQPDKMIRLNNEKNNHLPVLLKQNEAPVLFTPVVKSTPTAVVITPSHGLRKNWIFGISGSAGISGAKSGLKFFDGNKTMDAAIMASSVQPPFVYNNSSTEPKTIRNDFAFSAGIAARKPIGKRFVFSTGFLYEYMSTSSNVGVRINQANAVQSNTGTPLYYTTYSTKQQEYLNQYHFLSIPVTIHYQVRKKTPLYIHTGLSVKQLVKTNALEFNHQSQLYFYNRNAFNRTQLFPSFGIEYAMLKNQSLIIGPQVEGSLVALEKNGSNEHLFVGSLKVQWFFLKN